MNSRFSLSIIAIFLLLSCRNDETINEPTNEVSFNVRSIVNASGRIADVKLDDAAFLLISIEKVDGSLTDYLLEKIELYQVDNEYISQKITLPIGDYQLTEFFVTDSENNITHIAPLEGSEQAQNVSDPLPIEFSILIDKITSVGVEVISSEGLSLEDFGLAGFSLSEIELFKFLVTVSEQGNYDNLLGGTITVTSGDYQFTKELLAITNNSVIIKDMFSTYDIDIQKNGYHSFRYTFTKDSLAYYESTPLSIELVTSDSDDWSPGDDWVDARDGQSYATVQIGDQVWMAENLRAIDYNDGTPIPNVTEGLAWYELTTGAYCWYENDETLINTSYGALYNWYVVESEKICPIGWHVPSNEEWEVLETFLDPRFAGQKLKHDGLEYWGLENNGTNESGFTAIPSGKRNWFVYDENTSKIYGVFEDMGNYGYFWSGTVDHPTTRNRWELRQSQTIFPGPIKVGKEDGYCIRCIKD